MKLWFAWASSHSSDVRVTGRFLCPESAEEAAHLLSVMAVLAREGHPPEEVAAPFRERGLDLQVRTVVELHHHLYSMMNGPRWPFGAVRLRVEPEQVAVEYTLAGEMNSSWENHELAWLLGDIFQCLGAGEVEFWDGYGEVTWRHPDGAPSEP